MEFARGLGDTAGGYGIPLCNPLCIPMRIPQMPGVRRLDRAPHVGTIVGCGLRELQAQQI
jgi:hypothetical protein